MWGALIFFCIIANASDFMPKINPGPKMKDPLQEEQDENTRLRFELMHTQSDLNNCRNQLESEKEDSRRLDRALQSCRDEN